LYILSVYAVIVAAAFLKQVHKSLRYQGGPESDNKGLHNACCMAAAI